MNVDKWVKFYTDSDGDIYATWQKSPRKLARLSDSKLLTLSIAKWKFVKKRINIWRPLPNDGGIQTCALCRAGTIRKIVQNPDFPTADANGYFDMILRLDRDVCECCPIGKSTRAPFCAFTPYTIYDWVRTKCTQSDYIRYKIAEEAIDQEIEFLKGLRKQAKIDEEFEQTRIRWAANNSRMSDAR